MTPIDSSALIATGVSMVILVVRAYIRAAKKQEQLIYDLGLELAKYIHEVGYMPIPLEQKFALRNRKIEQMKKIHGSRIVIPVLHRVDAFYKECRHDL